MPPPELRDDGAAATPRDAGPWATYLAAAGVLLGFFVPFLNFGKALGQDWKYFDSQTLVVRSIVLHYHRLPLHDPWVMGGMDILGNPQSRVFSPTFLFDLALGPPYANFASLLACAFFGALGAYRLLRGLGTSSGSAVAGALVFVDSTWFALHFSEGHLPFGTFYLLPWVFHLARHAASPRHVLGLASLLTLFLLDGGMYPFIFSLLLIVGVAAAGMVDLRGFARGLMTHARAYAVGLLGLALVACAKVVPLLAVYGHRVPVQEDTDMPLATVAKAFFDWHQTIAELPIGSPHRFHEYGCYIGVVATLLVLVWLCTPGALRKSAGLLVLMVLWFWTATGWGGAWNPWTVFQHTPFINNAHVQSRFFLLFFLFFVVLLARALDWVKRRPIARGLAVFLVLEALLASGYTWSTTYLAFPGPEYTKTLITSPSITHTVFAGAKPEHYLDGTMGARYTYEPAVFPTDVKFLGEPGYRGEAYVTSGAGRVQLRELSPGRVVLTTEATTPLGVEINSNYLQGWRVSRGTAEVHPTALGLIGVELPPGGQSVVLAYAPRYLPWTLAAFIVGLALSLYTWASLLRRREPA